LLKTPVWGRKFLGPLRQCWDRRGLLVYNPSQKLHGKGHFAGKLEVYLIDLQVLTLAAPGDWVGQRKKEQKITSRARVFYFPKWTGSWLQTGDCLICCQVARSGEHRVCIYSANLAGIGTSHLALHD